MDIIINDSLDGRSVLDIIRRELGVSRATLKHLKFMENGIMLNGVHVTVRRTVSTGDVLSIAVEDAQSPAELTPSDISLDIAYEDENVVVPSKPADMPTHQSFGHYGDTVANALAYRYASKGIPFVFRPVNRLDKNTSGLLLIARNRLSAAFLFNAMKQKRINKQYVALLDGSLSTPVGESVIIDTYIRRTAKSIIVREVCAEDEGGDRAITEYTVLCKNDAYTLVRATPVTGRTHQLRVHFASLGAPILGDDMYGSPSELISRHALHSYFLSFPDADGKDDISVYSPLPCDMRSAVMLTLGGSLCEVNDEIIQKIMP